jgi:adenylosuccinate synthase
MPSLVVVGTQWGDEGKGKIVDYLAQRADLIVRFQGGANAGHSVSYGRHQFVFHQVPSGLTNPATRCLVGNGCVLDLPLLAEELAVLDRAGLSYDGRLLLDRKVHLVLPYHKLLDRLREESRGQRRIGTTMRGIGPCYEDKYARTGIRLADLLQEDVFSDRLRRNLAFKNFLAMTLYHGEPLNERQLRREFLVLGQRFAAMATDGSRLIAEALSHGKPVLFEGAQGPLLDIDHGTYPFVTSSSPTAGGASVGSGAPPSATANVLGVTKAYTTRVGKGPFPTEAGARLGSWLRRTGNEYGATTGRLRRCGWLDLGLVRYAVRLSGIRRLAVTKLDILDELPEIPVAVGYETPEGFLPDFDPTMSRLKPRYVRFPGWQRSLKGIRRFADLPRSTRAYLDRIQKELDCPVAIASVGESREATLLHNHRPWFQ